MAVLERINHPDSFTYPLDRMEVMYKGEHPRLKTRRREGEHTYNRNFPLPDLGAEGIEIWYDGSEHPFTVIRHFAEWHNVSDPGRRGKDFRCHVVTTCRYTCPCHVERKFFLWGDRWNKVRMI
jgi:hypothetical protein